MAKQSFVLMLGIDKVADMTFATARVKLWDAKGEHPINGIYNNSRDRFLVDGLTIRVGRLDSGEFYGGDAVYRDELSGSLGLGHVKAMGRTLAKIEKERFQFESGNASPAFFKFSSPSERDVWRGMLALQAALNIEDFAVPNRTGYTSYNKTGWTRQTMHAEGWVRYCRAVHNGEIDADGALIEAA